MTTDRFEATYPGITEALETDHHIVRDIGERAYRYGSISRKQADLVFKLAREAGERLARREEWAKETENAPPVPEGRHEVTGEVLSVKWKDSMYGGAYKMLVRDDRGFKVWGTLARALEDAYRDERTDLLVWDIDPTDLRGRRVSFTATFTRSDDDSKFGFFKRPTKAALLPKESVDDAPEEEADPEDAPVEPPAGSYAATARTMAGADPSAEVGEMWDRWKDEMKERTA